MKSKLQGEEIFKLMNNVGIRINRYESSCNYLRWGIKRFMTIRAEGLIHMRQSF